MTRNPLDVAIELPLVDDPSRRYEHSDTASSERMLWLAVLETAVNDAIEGVAGALAWWRTQAPRHILAVLGYDVGSALSTIAEHIKDGRSKRRQSARHQREYSMRQDAVYQRRHRDKVRKREEERARMERRFPGWKRRHKCAG